MIEIIVTKDGSHTLFNTELEETYHSIHGALQESKHVFISHGMEFALSSGKKKLAILEVGFGTGLNALLTLQHSIKSSVHVEYTAVEPFPLTESVWTQLNYADTTEAFYLFQKMHQSEWNKSASILTNFKLRKIKSKIQQVSFSEDTFDIIYFDAFAPGKQPEMWEASLLGMIIPWMKQGAILVTYCAKGVVKRSLKNLGLSVETLPGPPGKREMIRALKR